MISFFGSMKYLFSSLIGNVLLLLFNGEGLFERQMVLFGKTSVQSHFIKRMFNVDMIICMVALIIAPLENMVYCQ